MGTSLPDHVDTFRREAERCVALARSVDHAAPLPHLPGWTVGHVLAHLAGDLLWATTIVRERRSLRGPSSLRVRGATLIGRLEQLAGEMTVALQEALAQPDAPCPNFADGVNGTLSFWPRRQAHEATMHRWDVEVPAGDHAPIAPDVAADGIDELLAIYTARYGRQILSAPLTIRCSDTPGAWRVDPRPDLGPGRVGITRTELDPAGIVDVAGPAATLLLVMSHRLPPDDAHLSFGADAAAARAFLAGPLTA